MKKEDLYDLKKLFYTYWMSRVPELNEGEAIDHLEWELRTMKITPDLDSKTGSYSKQTKKSVKEFLKNKNIKFKL